MQTTKNRRLSRAVLALSVTLAGAAWADYQIIDLGRVNGSSPPGITPAAINNDGIVVGSYTTPSGVPHAVSYDGSQITDLSQYIGSYTSGASNISENGKIVGVYINVKGRSFILSNGVATDLGGYGVGGVGARAVNNNGDVAGTLPTVSPGSTPHAFLYSNGSMTDIGTLGGSESFGTSINSSGTMAGYSHITGNSEIHAFTYTSGVMSDLGTLGGFYSQAQAINDNGQVVGSSVLTANAGQHAFLYDSGVMSDLGTLGGEYSVAFSINNNGDIVGDSNITVGSINSYPFLYTNGAMLNLNTLLPANSGWVLLKARDVNDYGQIVGEGTFNGETHGYMLSPGC